MNRDIVAPLLTILILLSGCIGEEQTNVFYGEDIKPHIPVDDFILLDENGENIFTLRGSGWGHGVGLCQIGALGMALDGRKTDEILFHYYHSSELRKTYA